MVRARGATQALDDLSFPVPRAAAAVARSLSFGSRSSRRPEPPPVEAEHPPRKGRLRHSLSWNRTRKPAARGSGLPTDSMPPTPVPGEPVAAAASSSTPLQRRTFSWTRRAKKRSSDVDEWLSAPRAALRAWLVSHAHLDERVLPNVMAVLEREEIFELGDLRLLRQLPTFAECFSAVTARKIADALDEAARADGSSARGEGHATPAKADFVGVVVAGEPASLAAVPLASTLGARGTSKVEMADEKGAAIEEAEADAYLAQVEDHSLKDLLRVRLESKEVIRQAREGRRGTEVAKEAREANEQNEAEEATGVESRRFRPSPVAQARPTLLPSTLVPATLVPSTLVPSTLVPSTPSASATADRMPPTERASSERSQLDAVLNILETVDRITGRVGVQSAAGVPSTAELPMPMPPAAVASVEDTRLALVEASSANVAPAHEAVAEGEAEREAEGEEEAEVEEAEEAEEAEEEEAMTPPPARPTSPSDDDACSVADSQAYSAIGSQAYSVADSQGPPPAWLSEALARLPKHPTASHTAASSVVDGHAYSVADSQGPPPAWLSEALARLQGFGLLEAAHDGAQHGTQDVAQDGLGSRPPSRGADSSHAPASTAITTKPELSQLIDEVRLLRSVLSAMPFSSEAVGAHVASTAEGQHPPAGDATGPSDATSAARTGKERSCYMPNAFWWWE